MAEVSVIMTPQEAKLFKAQQKIIAQTVAMEKGYKKVGQSGKAAGDKATVAGKKSQQAFGARAVSGLKGYVTGMASVTTGIQLAAGAMRFFQEESDKARMSIDTLIDSRRGLSQITADSADLQALETQADALAVREGVARDVVRRTLFSGRSEGFTEFVPRLIQAEGANVLKAEAGATAAGQVPGLFPESPLDPAQAINAILFAARESRLDFESLAKVLPSAAEGAAQQKASPAETIGVTSVLASRFKSGETAADRLKALGGRMAIDTEFDLAGKGLIGGVERLEALPDEERRKFLGTSSELNSAYTAMVEEMEKIKERVAGVSNAMKRAGTSQSELSRAIARNTDQTKEIGKLNVATQRARSAAIAREVENERQLGVEGQERQAGVDKAITELKREEVSIAGQFAGERVGKGAQAFFALPASLIEKLTKGVGRSFGEGVGPAMPGTFTKNIIRAIKEQAQERRQKTAPPQPRTIERTQSTDTTKVETHTHEQSTSMVDREKTTELRTELAPPPARQQEQPKREFLVGSSDPKRREQQKDTARAFLSVSPLARGVFGIMEAMKPEQKQETRQEVTRERVAPARAVAIPQGQQPPQPQNNTVSLSRQSLDALDKLARVVAGMGDSTGLQRVPSRRPSAPMRSNAQRAQAAVPA